MHLSKLRTPYAPSARCALSPDEMSQMRNANGEGMKIAFPTIGNKGMDEEIGEHFGRAPTYTIVDLEKEEVKIIPNTSEHMGGIGYPPELLAREGVDVLICSGIGRKALSMFQGYKIKVYIAGRKRVREALQDFMDGLLKEACIDDGCVH